MTSLFHFFHWSHDFNYWPTYRIDFWHMSSIPEEESLTQSTNGHIGEKSFQLQPKCIEHFSIVIIARKICGLRKDSYDLGFLKRMTPKMEDYVTICWSSCHRHWLHHCHPRWSGLPPSDSENRGILRMNEYTFNVFFFFNKMHTFSIA